MHRFAKKWRISKEIINKSGINPHKRLRFGSFSRNFELRYIAKVKGFTSISAF
jgi:hypothetical protein